MSNDISLITKCSASCNVKLRNNNAGKIFESKRSRPSYPVGFKTNIIENKVFSMCAIALGLPHT